MKFAPNRLRNSRPGGCRNEFLGNGSLLAGLTRCPNCGCQLAYPVPLESQKLSTSTPSKKCSVISQPQVAGRRCKTIQVGLVSILFAVPGSIAEDHRPVLGYLIGRNQIQPD